MAAWLAMRNTCSAVLLAAFVAIGSAVPIAPHDSGAVIITADVSMTSDYASFVGEGGADISPSIRTLGGHRRMQAGSSLTITYSVSCGADCARVQAQLTNIASDPAAGAIHAQAIIDSINTAAAAAGFANAVLDTAATVAATLSVPPGHSEAL